MYNPGVYNEIRQKRKGIKINSPLIKMTQGFLLLILDRLTTK